MGGLGSVEFGSDGTPPKSSDVARSDDGQPGARALLVPDAAGPDAACARASAASLRRSGSDEAMPAADRPSPNLLRAGE